LPDDFKEKVDPVGPKTPGPLPFVGACDLDLRVCQEVNMRRRASLMKLPGAFLCCLALTLQPASAEDSGPAANFSKLYQAAAKEGEIIFYTDGRQEQAQRLSEYWKKNFPNVNLRLVPKSSPVLIAQIETERAAGQHRVDVSHMSQPYVAALWKQKGFYARYMTQSFARLRPSYADVDGAFYTPTCTSCRRPTTPLRSGTKPICRRA
jgi:hypothetical protein